MVAAGRGHTEIVRMLLLELAPSTAVDHAGAYTRPLFQLDVSAALLWDTLGGFGEFQ
jgi:hypothetical protein